MVNTCQRCEKVRPTVAASGLCNPCYVRNSARTDVCRQCQEPKQIQGHGLCRRCYLSQPHMVERKNAARRAAYAADPVRRRDAAAFKVADYSTPEGKARQAARSRRHAYRIEPHQFAALLAAQQNKCAICLLVFVEGAKRTAPHVDHCHSTGRVRGLLCAACNSGIGHLADDPDRLESAVRYLRQGN